MCCLDLITAQTATITLGRRLARLVLYGEVTPRQVYEAKRQFLSIHLAVFATVGELVRD